MLATQSPVLGLHRATMRRMFPQVSELFYRVMAEARKADAVYTRFVQLAADYTLSKEGFRQQFLHGRFPLNDLPRLCEAMALEGLDPTIPLAALEAACLPRDEELNGDLSNELSDLAIELGQLATTIRNNGHTANLDKQTLLSVAGIAGRSTAVARRLNQEALDALAEIADGKSR